MREELSAWTVSSISVDSDWVYNGDLWENIFSRINKKATLLFQKSKLEIKLYDTYTLKVRKIQGGISRTL